MWSKIYGYLIHEAGIYTGREAKTRRFVETVLWMLRTGAQWSALPKEYGGWRGVHKRFHAWSAKGVWQRMLEYCSLDHDGEWILLDSTITRAHPCASGYEKDGNAAQALGRSKGGFTCKIHALVDALGNPLRFRLTGGQRHDCTQAEALIEGREQAIMLADKGYDSDALIEKIERAGGTAVIPPRKNRKKPRDYDEELYKERNRIERFFAKLKNFRRTFSRFDKKADNYLAFISFAAVLITLI